MNNEQWTMSNWSLLQCQSVRGTFAGWPIVSRAMCWWLKNCILEKKIIEESHKQCVYLTQRKRQNISIKFFLNSSSLAIPLCMSKYAVTSRKEKQSNIVVKCCCIIMTVDKPTLIYVLAFNGSTLNTVMPFGSWADCNNNMNASWDLRGNAYHVDAQSSS